MLTRSFLVFLAPVGLALAGMAPRALAAEQLSQELATKLVEVMGVDEHALRDMRKLAASQYGAGQITRAQHDCILYVGREEFTAGLARIAARTLTEKEARVAIAYFGSAVGKRHLEAMDERGNVSASEWRERRAFLDTSAGYLLITRELLTASEAWMLVQRIIRRRMTDCEEATDRSPQATPGPERPKGSP